jgi:hypothetical protein
MIFYISTVQFTFQCDFSVSYKQLNGQNYRTLINNTLNVCAYLGGKKNVLIQWIVDLIWKELPLEYFHPCPFLVRFLQYNLKLIL